jgi:hypothetical protein
VVLTGCDAGDCHFRHGDRWVEARVARERMPKLRSRVPRERLLLSWHKPIDRRGLRRAREQLSASTSQGRPQKPAGASQVKRLGPTQIIGQVLAWGLFVVLTGVFAQWPRYSPLPEGHGELKLSMAHLTERLEPCVELSPEELPRCPRTCASRSACPRARAHAVVELRVDGELLLTEAVRPTGLAKGGRTYLQGNWSLPAGDYALELFCATRPGRKDSTKCSTSR